MPISHFSGSIGHGLPADSCEDLKPNLLNAIVRKAVLKQTLSREGGNQNARCMVERFCKTSIVFHRARPPQRI